MKRLTHTPANGIHVNLLADGVRTTVRKRLNLSLSSVIFFLVLFLSYICFFFASSQSNRTECIRDAVHSLTVSQFTSSFIIFVRVRERARVRAQHTRMHIRSEILMNESDAYSNLFFKWFMFVNIYVSNTNAIIFVGTPNKNGRTAKTRTHTNLIGIPKESDHQPAYISKFVTSVEEKKSTHVSIAPKVVCQKIQPSTGLSS